VKINYKITILFLAIVFGLWYSIPSLLQTENGKKINLGLDLRGGMHMLLRTNVEEAVENKIKSVASALKYYIEKEEIITGGISLTNGRIDIEVLDKSDILKVEKMLNEIGGLEIKRVKGLFDIKLTEETKKETREWAVKGAVETIRNRLDQFGLAEPTVMKRGDLDIVVQVPGIKTAEEEKNIRGLIAKRGDLKMMAVDENLNNQAYSISEREAQNYGSTIKDSKEGRKYILKDIPILDGKEIVDARVAFDESNQPIISFTLSSLGGKIFGDFTENNIGKRLAIVLDDIVYSAPVIRSRIGGGSGQISGGFTIEEAGTVAIALKSGALPASVDMVEKRSVGPSLGADSIKASIIALVSGFVLVIIFMIIYYGIAGVISNIAIIANIILIIAIMSLFGATLTLPGMAGIVLTVGMAVDANVIITERIRELLKEGKRMGEAIKEGYSNAIRAILDANITTLLVAIILYAYGTGPIKGFAVTISIGILVSMLTAIIGTQGIYEMLLKKIKNQKIWFGIKGDK